MVHLHMSGQGIQSTREKPPDKYLEYKIKKMQGFALPWTLVQHRRGNFTQIYADAHPSNQAK